jgi:betaine-aldehyde dehydrogenase
MAAAPPAAKLFIGGRWVPPIHGASIPVVNPHDGSTIGAIAAGTSEDVAAAAWAAKHAFAEWSATTGAHRASILRAIATEIKKRKDALSSTETNDCGKPLEESEWDIDDAAACFEYYASRCEAIFGSASTASKPVSLPDASFRGTLVKEPLGVVGLITPWNYPLLMAVWKVAPALAAGCAVVLKPSELASLTCLELADVARVAGVPPGVFNVVTGAGADAGAAVCVAPGIDKIAFTGSLATGRRVARACSEEPKPCSLKLGGKSTLVVFDDVDVDVAVEWAMFGCFWTNGQICSATSRVLVHERIAEAFKRKLRAAVAGIDAGEPRRKGCRLGPLVSAGQRDKVLAYIANGISNGVEVLCGGCEPPRGKHVHAAGYYVAPTVFWNVPQSDPLWKEEIFGPVMSVREFRDEDEAIEIANDSEYGLAAAVLSNDDARCERMTGRFQAGIVWQQCSQPCFAELPWGGKKRSGFGRDLGEDGMEKYLHTKQVVRYASEEPFGWYPSCSKL